MNELKTDLSVVIPVVGGHEEAINLEYTMASIFEEFNNRGIDFEIIVVDNDCPEWRQQIAAGHISLDQAIDPKKNKSHTRLLAESAQSVNKDWIVIADYNESLSHWQAKNKGVSIARGDIIFFIDSHCLVSRDTPWQMFCWYRENWQELKCTLHSATTYQIRESLGHIRHYEFVPDLNHGFLGYRLTQYVAIDRPEEVRCECSCGMFISKCIFNLIGGFPQIHAYGGGENYLNFILPTLGYTKYLWPGYVRHKGSRRAYHYTGEGLIKNRADAMYLIGGENMLCDYLYFALRNENDCENLVSSFFWQTVIRLRPEFNRLAELKIVDIYDWVKNWRAK